MIYSKYIISFAHTFFYCLTNDFREVAIINTAEDKKLNPEELLRSGQAISISPQGYSMYPLIYPGRDRVVIEPIADEYRLKRGDVVLFRGKGNVLELHRIAKKVNDVYYIVGDNQKEMEGPIEEAAICGIVTEITRKGKKIDTANGWYKFVTGIWLFLRPIRPAISKTIHFFKTIGKKH